MNEEMLTFSAGVFNFWEKERRRYQTSQTAFIFRTSLYRLVLHLQRRSRDTKQRALDYEKHGDGVCFGGFWVCERLGECVRKRERRTDGLWTTVRLQHSRDEFPFVCYFFFFSFNSAFVIYLSYHVDDDTKMVGMGGLSVSLPFVTYSILFFGLMRRDDILVSRAYITLHHITLHCILQYWLILLVFLLIITCPLFKQLADLTSPTRPPRLHVRKRSLGVDFV
jgi:hypothetical protein